LEKLLSILNQPYPYYIPFSRSYKLLPILSIIGPLFLITFEPFGLAGWQCDFKVPLLVGLTVPILLSLVINFYLVSRLLPVFFDEDSWSIWREILWSMWNLATIILATAFYWKWMPFCPINTIDWGQQISNTLLVVIFPGSVCIYFNYSRALKRKLGKAQVLNQRLASKIALYESGSLTLVGENKSEVIKIDSDNLILIQSYDNYSKIVLENQGQIKSRLIRSSLKNLAVQINFPFIIRCHRSFIVNLAKIKEVKGNARDYRLLMNHFPDLVPVSREAYKEIQQFFQQFSPKLEGAGSYSYAAEKSH